VLIIHRAEDRKTTNTGRLALFAMANSEVIVRGRANERNDALRLDGDTRPLLLFPHDDAVPLATVARVPGDDRPVTLIVPDGTWRQAAKIRNRVTGLREVPPVSVPVSVPSIYRLRTEAHTFGLSTIEVIARALRILEGDAGPAVEGALLRVFRAMVERTLWSRGKYETQNVTGGVPEGVLRHDPGSGSPRSED
jgi:DTW domain-containing protein YfiP